MNRNNKISWKDLVLNIIFILLFIFGIGSTGFILGDWFGEAQITKSCFDQCECPMEDPEPHEILIK